MIPADFPALPALRSLGNLAGVRPGEGDAPGLTASTFYKSP
jgi:hypothetical protein